MTEAVVQDRYSPALNPCSLEILSLPIRLGETGRKIWPLIMSCYDLQEDGSRKGQMDLFCVDDDGREERDGSSRNNEKPLRFGNPLSIEMSPGGILDGKWCPRQSDGVWWFATAKSTGQVALHSFRIGSNEDEDGDEDGDRDKDKDRADKLPNFVTKQIAISEPLESSSGTTPLCLAINWNNPQPASSFDTTHSLVASYSNGVVAIFDVSKSGQTGRPHLVKRTSWLAHTLFGKTPAEVWSTCFAANGKLVMSGGDDAKLKLWDVRSDTTTTDRPVQTFQHFDAGVTVLSPHPRNEHLVAAGSYDETVVLYDIRYPTGTGLLGRSDSLGGGIWRIQWHPHDDQKVLIAAMHGGCRVVNLQKNEEGDTIFDVVKRFTEHKSMAYGAGWLVRKDHSLHAAASCSFYDRAAFLWGTE